jgi:hypothetical protein
MPRKSPGHDSRMITYRTLPGSSTRYQRVNVGECTAWVQTNLEFDLQVQHPDQTTETRPYIIDTHGGTKPKRAQRARNRQAPSAQRRRRLRRLTVRNQYNSLA